MSAQVKISASGMAELSGAMAAHGEASGKVTLRGNLKPVIEALEKANVEVSGASAQIFLSGRK